MKTLYNIRQEYPKRYWNTPAWKDTVTHLENVADLLRLTILRNKEESKVFLAAVVVSSQQCAVVLAGQHFPPGFIWYDKDWLSHSRGRRQARAYASACINSRVKAGWETLGTWSSGEDRSVLVALTQVAIVEDTYPPWLARMATDAYGVGRKEVSVLAKARSQAAALPQKEKPHVWKRPGRFKRTKNTK